IRRDLITSGKLEKYVQEDGLRGMTSNPAIFEKAFTSSEYAGRLKDIDAKDATAIYERLAVPDIQDAADVLRPLYDESKARDGYVSLEVSPYLAKDTQKTLEEARRLWKLVDRPNVMIKVPGTPEGIPAFGQLISEGVNVNVTLLFAVDAYLKVAETYIEGVERFTTQGGDPSRVASVASFFVSRIDVAIDELLDKRPEASALLGKVAIANAKLAYEKYERLFGSARWKKLEDRGAQRQRLLWASTGTKNPKYRDVLYVEELIGADTVNTMPPATFDAFRDHGKLRNALQEDLAGAHNVMDQLAKTGISMEEITGKLLVDGLKLFAEAFDKLLNALDARCKSGVKPKLTGQTYAIPAEATSAVRQSLDDWQAGGKVRRLWAGDASLWTGADEGKWLGWLTIADDQLAHAHHLEELSQEVKSGGFTHAVLLGMGGSSLCPEVMKMTFGKIDGFPEMHVLDSTDPAQIRTLESKLDLMKTLFIVSSKSGSTLEPNIFKQYFYEKAGRDGSRFIAVTDPDSNMQKAAEAGNFRKILFGLPSIGGRYSALSDFGMAPSSVMGLDVKKFLDRTEEMVQACTTCVPVDQNPGVVLGTVLGTLGKQGKDKITIVASPAISDLGAWLEQLIAESTGKNGKGLIPVDREKLGAPEVYGHDRVFAYERFTPEPDAAQDAAVDALEKAGHPVIRIAVDDRYDLGQEFFRWEIATAVAGSILGINPFDQPDVEASKIATKKLTSQYEKTGSLPPEKPIFEGDGIKLFGDDSPSRHDSLSGYLRAHLDRLREGDYFALLAYIQMNAENEATLQAMRHAVRDSRKVATCLGFGPRFLHSTGQAYKGGPNTGVFLQITCDDADDLAVPGQKYTFGTVKAAQARGDFEVLTERKRRALRVHLGADVRKGLEALRKAL
ncbi:MAG: bifunctional transaldolase/phosoglucose isomerase, partial [Acidobacteriota bacterium]|nr:bifunctional transaldolase/phosoglucose isomerase [Acidobacteriota bacterium]